MRRNVMCALLAGMLVNASASAGNPFPLASEDRILPSSLELEQRVEPWCPNACEIGVPFVASYRKGSERLVFVGAHHAFHPNDPTMRAVAFGFSQLRPKILIAEGFPTAMGESPHPLVEASSHYGAPGTDEFSNSEMIYAVSTAVNKGIPFVGGEPTREEEMSVLKSKGFTDADLAFSAMAGGYSQALRSGDMRDMSLDSLTKQYPLVAEWIKSPLADNGLNMDAPSFEEFRERYKDMYGVDVVGDDQMPLRIDIGDTTRHGKQNKIAMMLRDRHLLGLIEQQLTDRHTVLVVYGGSHWATLSAALQERLGSPKIKPFLR